MMLSLQIHLNICSYEPLIMLMIKNLTLNFVTLGYKEAIMMITPNFIFYSLGTRTFPLTICYYRNALVNRSLKAAEFFEAQISKYQILKTNFVFLNCIYNV
jgi:hypothetical protein